MTCVISVRPAPCSSLRNRLRIGFSSRNPKASSYRLPSTSWSSIPRISAADWFTVVILPLRSMDTTPVSMFERIVFL